MPWKDGLDGNPSIKQRQPIRIANRQDVLLGGLHLFDYGDASIGGDPEWSSTSKAGSNAIDTA